MLEGVLKSLTKSLGKTALKEEPSVLSKLAGDVKPANTIKNNTSFKDSLEKLRGQAFDAFDSGDLDVIDDILEKQVMDQARAGGFNLHYNDDWGNYMVDVSNAKDMLTAGNKLKGLAGEYGFDLNMNPDGSIRLYHGTTPENAKSILKNGFDGGGFFSHSTDDLVGGVNGAKYYGDNIITADIDPRELIFNPSGEFSIDSTKGILNTMDDSALTYLKPDRVSRNNVLGKYLKEL